MGAPFSATAVAAKAFVYVDTAVEVHAFQLLPCSNLREGRDDKKRGRTAKNFTPAKADMQ
jgi:hypothetical protein